VERFLFVADPECPATRRRIVRHFAEQHEASLAFDPARMGWPGVVAAEEGWVRSDDIVVGASPDVGGLGGLGALVLRGRPDELVRLLRHKTMTVQAPAGYSVNISGRLPRWVGAQELALHVSRAVGESAVGRVIELGGRGVFDLAVDERMTLCAALAREGLSSLVPPDEATRVWLSARDPEGDAASPAETPEAPDADLTLQAQKLGLVARAGGSLVNPAADPGLPVDEVVVAGSVTTLRRAAEALQERRLKPGMLMYILPASRRTLLHALEEGLITAFLRSGAILLTPGSTAPERGRSEHRVTTVATSPHDLLAGPDVVVASAVCGRLVDPEVMRREHRRTTTIR
jgi:3-isopropylmalate/(R)-2-methylmalate dehydratase large subunit